MSDSEHGYENLPPGIRQAILERCEDFAETWQSDSLTQINSILAKPLPETLMGGETLLESHAEASCRTVPETAATPESVLLFELLRIDVRNRINSGTQPDRATYVSNFPNATEVIEAVFEQLLSGTLTTLTPGSDETAQQTLDESAFPPRRVTNRLDETELASEPSPANDETLVDSQAGKSDASDAPTLDESDVVKTGQTAARRRLKASAIPQMLGDYELLSKLGEGGMGVVYLALQKSAGRKVALKIIRPDRLGGLSETRNQQAIERFRTEAMAAAKIQHDHLVTVYEVGFANDCHFFSMQFVEGSSLAEMLRLGPVDPKQAARWLEPACRAVQAVHDNGILHRDLKPQNILLEKATGKTLVADFGLAKLAESDSELTHSGEAMGTPPYMSPEQFRDAASVTTATDIYALGATLYHLLSGRPPFQAATTAQTMRQVMDKDPVALRQLNPALDRDVETICMKCLEKEPAKRYSTATDLADELKRYLEGKAILARPIGRLERGVRWCRRNPLAATFAGIAAASIVVAVASLAVSNVNTETSRQRAEASFQDALEAVNDFFTKVSEERLLNEPGMQGLRKDLLVRAHTYYQRLLERRGGDATVSKELAATHYRLGVIVEQLYPGDLHKALASYNLARESQLSILERSKTASAEEMFAARRALSLTENALGRALIEKGNADATAKGYFETALDLREQLIDSAKTDAEKIEATRLWANTLMNLGIMQRRVSNFAAAKKTYELAQERREQVLALDPATRDLRRDLAKGCVNLANLSIDQSTNEADFAEPSEQLKKAIGLLEALLKDQPADLHDRYLLMVCHRMLGDLHAKLAESTPDARGLAIDNYTQAELAIRDLANRNPDIASYRVELARLLMNLGLMLAQQGRFPQANERFVAAQEFLQQIKDQRPDGADNQQAIDEDLATVAEKIKMLRSLIKRP